MRKFLFALIVASTAAYGSVVAVTDPTLIQTTDVVNWGLQLGGDMTPVSQTFFVDSTNSDNVVGRITNGSGNILVAGTDAAAGTGITAGDDLLAMNGNAPVTFYLSPTYGVDTYIQGDGGAFTARIQAFAGVNSVLDAAVGSDANGDPLYLGVSSSTANITKVIFSLTSVAAGLNIGDFTMDNLQIQNQVLVQATTPPPAPQQPIVVQPLDSGGQGIAPEPGTASLFGAALLTLVFTLKKRQARI